MEREILTVPIAKETIFAVSLRIIWPNFLRAFWLKLS